MIRIQNLVVTLGTRRIVDHLDLDLKRGETVAMVGSNGAGKTTVLRALLGLVPFSGEILVGGVDIHLGEVEVKAMIGYMPQVPVFCEERADEALLFLASLRGLPRDIVPPLLARVGLDGHAHRSVRVFSTGMRQRLSLAAALMGNPPLLVFDEPTASLDLKGQAEILQLMQELQAEGRTLLISSHRAEEIRTLAHRVVLLDEGRKILEGSPADMESFAYQTALKTDGLHLVRGAHEA